MGILGRLLQRRRPPADGVEPELFHVDVESSLLSDRRTFHLTYPEGYRQPLRMLNLTYTFRAFTLHVHEKALRVVGVDLEARGEPLEDANFVAAFLGGRPAKVEGGAVVDLMLRLKPDVIRTHFSHRPRRDDPRQVLDVRDREGHVVALDLRNYALRSWNVRR